MSVLQPQLSPAPETDLLWRVPKAEPPVRLKASPPSSPAFREKIPYGDSLAVDVAEGTTQQPHCNWSRQTKSSLEMALACFVSDGPGLQPFKTCSRPYRIRSHLPVVITPSTDAAAAAPGGSRNKM